jgi:hypothetical protein
MSDIGCHDVGRSLEQPTVYLTPSAVQVWQLVGKVLSSMNKLMDGRVVKAAIIALQKVGSFGAVQIKRPLHRFEGSKELGKKIANAQRSDLRSAKAHLDCLTVVVPCRAVEYLIRRGNQVGVGGRRAKCLLVLGLRRGVEQDAPRTLGAGHARRLQRRSSITAASRSRASHSWRWRRSGGPPRTNAASRLLRPTEAGSFTLATYFFLPPVPPPRVPAPVPGPLTPPLPGMSCSLLRGSAYPFSSIRCVS